MDFFFCNFFGWLFFEKNTRDVFVEALHPAPILFWDGEPWNWNSCPPKKHHRIFETELNPYEYISFGLKFQTWVVGLCFSIKHTLFFFSRWFHTWCPVRKTSPTKNIWRIKTRGETAGSIYTTRIKTFMKKVLQFLGWWNIDPWSPSFQFVVST